MAVPMGLSRSALVGGPLFPSKPWLLPATV